MKSMDEKSVNVVESSRFGFHGRLAIDLVHLDGATERYFEDDNLIVTSGKQIALLSLYTSSLNDSLTYAKVGTGGSTNPPPGGDGSLLKTPITSLTDLYSPLTQVGIAKVSQNLSIPSITLVANLDNSQGNGSFINEAGFFSGNGLMFNIKVFPGIQKTWAFSVNFQWTISVV
jgi:hypothetical protein